MYFECNFIGFDIVIMVVGVRCLFLLLFNCLWWCCRFLVKVKYFFFFWVLKFLYVVLLNMRGILVFLFFSKYGRYKFGIVCFFKEVIFFFLMLFLFWIVFVCIILIEFIFVNCKIFWDFGFFGLCKVELLICFFVIGFVFMIFILFVL